MSIAMSKVQDKRLREKIYNIWSKKNNRKKIVNPRGLLSDGIIRNIKRIHKEIKKWYNKSHVMSFNVVNFVSLTKVTNSLFVHREVDT